MRQALIALDQLVNVWLCWLIPGGVWADETLSAKAWRIRGQWPRLYQLIDAIFFWEPDHCHQAYEIELARLETAPKERLQQTLQASGEP